MPRCASTQHGAWKYWEHASPEALAALLSALYDDADAQVRASAAMSLGVLEHASPEVTVGLCEALNEAESWSVRRDSARLLSRTNLEKHALIDTLWQGLSDKDNDVREACVQELVQLGGEDSAIAKLIETRFIQAIHDPKFDTPDKVEHRPAYDYIYEGLWALVVISETEGTKG